MDAKVKFSDYRLTRQDKKIIKERIPANLDIQSTIENMCEIGYKVSISFTEKTGAYWVSLTGRVKGHPNYNTCLSIPHRDITVAIFAHELLLDMLDNGKGWATLESDPSDVYDW